MKTLRERCAAIELLIVDVDGILTDGGIVYGQPDLEIKQFDARDGFGLKRWQHAGKRTAVLTGRSSPLVARRAAELGIVSVVQGAVEKLPAYRRLLEEAGAAEETVCYVGDDVPDVPPLGACGLAATAADARSEARAVAHYITRACGGRGAVREIIELILRCQGRWRV